MTNFLNRYLLATALALFSLGANAAPLVTPSELQAEYTDGTKTRIVDIRPQDDYQAGHIPGALSAPYGQWRGPAESPGQLVETHELTQLVRQLGIEPDTRVIVVSSGADATDFGASARVYWTLKYLGLTDLSILNGGMHAWQENELALEQTTPQVPASDFTPTLNTSILATQDYVASHLDKENVLLVDARPADFYLGKTKAPTAKMPGTIRNAINVSHDKWFEPGTSTFVSADKARQIAQQTRSEPAEETISFCNTGHWAATDWFALSEVVGQPNVRLYPASLAEWTQASTPLPMDNVPGRGQQLVDQLKNLFGNS